MGALATEFKNYRSSGGDAFGGGSVGFACGGFVAIGEGSGGSASTDLVGEGNGRFDGFLVFEFSFTLSLALIFTPLLSFGLPLTSGESEVFVLVLADWLVVPPAGIPASDSPVGGFAGSTGLLFGSAASVEPDVVAFVG